MARPSLAPGVTPSLRARPLPAADARTSLAARMLAWDRQASGWWSFLATQGRSPAEITEIIQDALGPRPGTADPADETTPLSTTEAPPPSAHLGDAPTQLPPFQWGDRVPLPPPMSTTAHVWPHPLGEPPVEALAPTASSPGTEGTDEPPASPRIEPAPAKKKAARKPRARKSSAA